MGKIHVLDFQVANLIAAGEVVDRPASVVKELLENAIDAGATAVTVEIKRGGVSFIRVTDNGCGMSRQDVPLALKRHATSKVSTAADLDSIGTLGFRGEALAAISSVSKVRIMTKQRGDTVGTLLEAHGGTVVSVSDTGCPDGTTILVEELFYNTPARLKFLRKDGTEAGNVAAYVEKIALSHPDISFRFLSDGELRYITTGDGDRMNTLYAVLGRDFAKKTVRIDGNADGIRVSGFIGTPENTRGNRNFQIFFINNRYVKSKTVSAALEQAFATYIPQDKFPCAVLWMTCDLSSVDVNVHPAKLEVKFASERSVFESVYYAVRGALEQKLRRPEMELEEKIRRAERQQNAVFAPAPYKAAADSISAVSVAAGTVCPPPDDSDAPPPSPFPVPDSPGDDGAASVPQDTAEPFTEKEPEISVPPIEAFVPTVRTEEYKTAAPEIRTVPVQDRPAAIHREAEAVPVMPEPSVPVHKEEPEQTAELPQYTYIGELFHCYLLCEAGNTVYVIDKHAAHERILFEQLKAVSQKGEDCIQPLLLPLPVSLTAEEGAAAEEFTGDLNASGFFFTLREDGKSAALESIPSFFDAEQAVEGFRGALSDLTEQTGTVSLSREIRFERALFQAACKAAIKGGRTYDESHLKWIINKVFTDPAIRVCPHGRPVCFTLTESELEKRFGRIK